MPELPTPAKPGHRPVDHSHRSARELDFVGRTGNARVDDTDGRRVVARLPIFDAVLLGCGCFRLYAYRPGQVADDAGHWTRPWVQLLTGCPVHHREVRL